MPAEKTVDETYLEIGCRQEKNGIMIGQAYSYSEDGKSVDLYTIRQSEYEKLTGEKTDLHDGEIFAWYPSEKEKDILKIDDRDFAVKKWLEKAPLSAMNNLVSNMAAIVVTDSDFEYIDGLRTKMYEGLDAYEAGKDLTVHLGVDIRGSGEEKIRYGQAVYQALKDYCRSGGFSENTIVIGGVRQSEYETYYVDNGTILFIGIFLGSTVPYGNGDDHLLQTDLRGLRRSGKVPDHAESRYEPQRGERSYPQTDPSGIFYPACDGNGAYFHGISADPPAPAAVRNGQYKIVRGLHCGNGSGLCAGLWTDLLHDSQILL